MNKTYFILLISIFLLLSCASRKYIKKGLEFEQVGYFEKAADMYYLSLTKKANNVEATIGLKKNGQKTVDKKAEQFMEFYNKNLVKDAVYGYTSLIEYVEKVKKVGVVLDYSRDLGEYYGEVKDLYLSELYNEAYLLLEDEAFVKAETKFTEIIKLDPNYGDVEALKTKAHYEPIYRKGKQQLDQKKFRSAYYSFHEIISALSNYKDANELMKNALTNALLTISVSDFKNSSMYRNVEKQFEAGVEKELNALNSPFIKIVDRDNKAAITNEQLLTLEGKVDENVNSKAGLMMGVKAILTAELLYYSVEKGDLEKTEKKGYLKETKIVKKDGHEDKEYVYHKTNYYEYEQKNKVVCRFQFKLISTETSLILVTDVISTSAVDEIHYAQFNGKAENLVMGNWESLKKDSPKDEVIDNHQSNRYLQRLLKADKVIKPIEHLQNEIQNEVTKTVAQKILNYDPEK